MTTIALRPFTRDDFARLVAWSPTEEFLMQWAGPYFRFPLDEAQLETYWQSAQGDAPIRRVFTVVDSETNTPIGHVELNNIDRRNRSATLARVLIGEPARRGKGVGAQMIKRVLEIGFGELGLHRIDLAVFDFNASAIACYEKLGFVKEGRLREARRVGEAYWSVYLMSMLESEWRSARRET